MKIKALLCILLIAFICHAVVSNEFQPDDKSMAIAGMINAFRTGHGLDSLALDNSICLAAQIYNNSIVNDSLDIIELSTAGKTNDFFLYRRISNYPVYHFVIKGNTILGLIDKLFNDKEFISIAKNSDINNLGLHLSNTDEQYLLTIFITRKLVFFDNLTTGYVVNIEDGSQEQTSYLIEYIFGGYTDVSGLKIKVYSYEKGNFNESITGIPVFHDAVNLENGQFLYSLKTDTFRHMLNEFLIVFYNLDDNIIAVLKGKMQD